VVDQRVRPHDRSARIAPGRRPERRARPALHVVGASVREGATRVRRGATFRRVVGVSVGVVVAAALVLWLFLAGPWLRVNSVNVVGGDAGQQAAVHRVADRELGQPLVKVDSAAVQRDLAGVPAFSRVDVIRDWPDRLTVSVVVRTPVLALKMAQGPLQLVDADGVVYAPVDAPPQGVPPATVAHPDNAREVRSAAGVLAALDAGQRAKVSSVTATSPDDVRFVIDGVTVQWGGPSDGRRKAVTMAALLHQKGIKTINVSAPDSPVIS
jgi:cell division protein FtsQ